MFGIGFFELFVVALVALLVIGPARLPQAMADLGTLVRRGREWLAHVQAGLNLGELTGKQGKSDDK